SWRTVAARYGFVEYDGPTLESVELYAKKNESGAEILQQLYQFPDKGGRQVALRPEMTPTLARMVAARERQYRKPLKWFSIASFFRYERQQKGRLREFIQLNCDLIGDAGSGADAEVVALAVDLMRELGFGSGDFVVRISDRRAWMAFLAAKGVPAEHMGLVLQAADKLEREPAESLDAKLAPAGISVADLQAFIAAGSPEAFAPLLDDLRARGLGDFVEVDLSIVRGLAYYTGVVFEIFDRSKAMRALAGGGRYDDLIKGLSDGASDLPAIGFGMGDVVLGNFIDAVPRAAERLRQHLAAGGCDIYVVIADEARRAEALGVVQTLRNAGLRVEYALSAAKVGKQFQTAESLGASLAAVVGQEWPAVKIKTLATRQEEEVSHTELADWLQKRQKDAQPQ
ncbi:MAG TPA: ATP phosphoribosyltransferase regulatory subunit, partial [Terrimicrobiaceae bacterium]|nr:ATP phosphoribosyltransferase regulatory subunit [Terrimicrobiaceae bacterium]